MSNILDLYDDLEKDQYAAGDPDNFMSRSLLNADPATILEYSETTYDRDLDFGLYLIVNGMKVSDTQQLYINSL